MGTVYFVLIALAAFSLGSCPFAVWIGKWRLNKDIRRYGDHNPGAANVFKAGSIKWGFIAVFLEIAKGVPFVLLAELYFKLVKPEVLLIGICAVLGHAISPFLKLQGGKATAVTGGVLLASSDRDVLIPFVILIVIGFFILDGDGWRIVLSAFGTLLYVIFVHNDFWLAAFFVVLIFILTIKNFAEIQLPPRRKKHIYIGFGQGQE
jgi:acyl phosphate:glycerol-3-phosphate acyltransferase